MKKLFILFSVFLVFLSFALPCFATNEGLYGHYVSPGNYMLAETIDFSYLDIEANGRYSLVFDFVANGINYSGFYFAKGVDDSIYQLAYLPDHNTVYSTYGDVTGWLDSSYRTIEILDGFYIDDLYVFSWWSSNVVRVNPGFNGGLIDGILSVFAFIGSWLGSAFASLQAIFFADGSLTVIGTLSVLGLAFAVTLLIFNILRSFVKFR